MFPYLDLGIHDNALMVYGMDMCATSVCITFIVVCVCVCVCVCVFGDLVD